MEIYVVIYQDKCNCGHAEHIVGIFAEKAKALTKAEELNQKESDEWRAREQEAIEELEWCLKNNTWVIPSGTFPWVRGYSSHILKRTHEQLKKDYAKYIENAQSYKVIESCVLT